VWASGRAVEARGELYELCGAPVVVWRTAEKASEAEEGTERNEIEATQMSRRRSSLGWDRKQVL
jgi:hypothetical protein